MTFHTSIYTIASHFLVRKLILRQRSEARFPIGARLSLIQTGTTTRLDNNTLNTPTYGLPQALVANTHVDLLVPSLPRFVLRGVSVRLHACCCKLSSAFECSHWLLHGVQVMRRLASQKCDTIPLYDRDFISDFRVILRHGVDWLVTCLCFGLVLTSRPSATWPFIKRS